MSTELRPAAAPSRALHLSLWGVQVLLALLFFAAGAFKATQPIDELAKNMAWVTYSPAAMVRFVGIVEVLGAIGLIVPAATRLKPALTPLAALGLATVMLFAVAMHGTQGEGEAVPVNLVLGALAGFVAWGRWVKAPIAAR